MSDSPYITARKQAEAAAVTAQDSNRLWWESLPMTYKAWENDDRQLSDAEITEELTKVYLESTPFLAEDFDFAAFAGKDVLEIGCGAGAASSLFAKAGARMTAIDLTEQGVGLTRRAAEVLGLKIDVRQMDAETLEFADGAFDFVYTWGVIHHSHQTEKIVAEIARVLKPGGRVLCMVYNRDSLRYWLKGAIWLFARGKILQGYNFDTVQQFFTDGYYHRHFSKTEFARVFADAGMVLERLTMTHMVKRMIPKMPKAIDDRLKDRYGWLLVGEFRRTSGKS